MAHAPNKSSWNEQLWNVSLLPTPAAARAVQVASGPGPQDRSDALRSGALLSLVETETRARLSQAA